MLRAAVTALLAGVAVGSGLPASATARPIIGIWAHPSNALTGGCGGKCEYLAASYVKWVESAGGRAVPIPYNDTEATLKLIPQLNGVLLPGGSAEVSAATKAAFKLIQTLNTQGQHYPLWGTCLGFEWLAQLFADDLSILGSFYAENTSMALQFTNNAEGSRLLGGASGERAYLRQVLSNETNPPTMNNHGQGVAVTEFSGSGALAPHLSLLSTNVGSDGKEFASTFESKGYPIYGVQWHPEKNNFEWGVQKADPSLAYDAINHSPEAVYASQAMADFFMAEARKNSNGFSSFEAEQSALIHNYAFHTDPYSGLWQKYYFHF
eukprot:TRINITY_DN25662_c0_g1_i1.p2 TRINITY_DN25662_c0_g1~~TRINITY_DN25662_c0_g1_i1.p2  ORF type:complete len:322 (+),score=136.52 TRINITY_DN25662_c0_g1_i1:55-1020(+)